MLLALLAAACDVAAPSWSTIHGDGHNSDYSAVAGPTDVVLAWERRFDGLMAVGATIDPQGRVYVTESSDGCNLHVLDPTDGATLWCSDEVDRFSLASSPLIDADGRVFVGDGEAMRAFSADGELLWETPINGVPLSAQFTANGRVLSITHLGVIYVLRRESGAPLLAPVELIPGATWDPAAGISSCLQGTQDCPSANTPAVDIDTGRLYFTFWPPGAAQVEVRGMAITEDPAPALTPLWVNDTLPGGSASSPTVAADGTRLYVTDNVGAIHALDAVTGEAIWSHPIGYAPGGSLSVSPDGVVMPAGGAGPLLAVLDEGATPRELWRRADLSNRGIATQTAGELAFATVTREGLTNDVVVIDTANGLELDREQIPGNAVFTVGTTVGPDGTIYVPTIGGNLYAYRAASASPGIG